MKFPILAAILAGLTLAGAQAQSFSTFNYPLAGEGSTYLTGIRGDGSAGTNHVFMTGVYTPAGSSNTQGLIYRGSITANTGTWTAVNFPSDTGRTVTSTALYGPNDLGGGQIRAVGSYKTVENGSADIGLIYEGAIDGSGIWKTLDAREGFDNPNIRFTIAHSNHGNYAVGNYDVNLDTGKAFIYDITGDEWYNFLPSEIAGATSITAYGIWHNGGTSYTIAGGFSIDPSPTGLDQGYLVDWDSVTKGYSHFRAYNFGNHPVQSVISHFDGITGDGNGGYYLTGDYVGAGAEDGLAFFAAVSREGDGHFGDAVWTQLNYPGSSITSGNSVYETYAIGIYIMDGGVPQGYVAAVPEPATLALAGLAAMAGILRRRRKN